jgi:hypothetical protein
VQAITEKYLSRPREIEIHTHILAHLTTVKAPIHSWNFSNPRRRSCRMLLLHQILSHLILTSSDKRNIILLEKKKDEEYYSDNGVHMSLLYEVKDLASPSGLPLIILYEGKTALSVSPTLPR